MGTLTVVIAADTTLRFAYEDSASRIALETSTALIGLLLGVLALGRLRQTQSLGDLGLATTCSFQPGCDVPPAVGHELARVVHEAASNAVRHANASSLAVELDRTGR